LKTRTPLVISIVLILCASCTEPTAPPPSVPLPTPSPTPEPKILTVCLPDEPDSLYLYGSDSASARHIWQAIYDGPLDNRTYTHQPVILTDLPSFADGSAALETLAVQSGDRVLSAGGDVAELAPGVTVEDAEGQRVTFDGAPILMERMVVTFTLRPNLNWADGAPLTADDSVYSFELAAATSADKHTILRTAGYRAADARTVVWSGVPGLLDHFYYLNFWHPLPRHAWGNVPAADLLTAEGSTRRPLGWGPFVLREWVRGDHLTVARNPLYFRAAEGLPHLDEVIFRFISDPTILARELLSGRCDVVTHDTADMVLAALPNQPPIELFVTRDSRWELLAFGISPAPGYERHDFFEDVRVRQGIAHCLDRSALAERVLHGYLPPEHPLHAGDALTTWEYDPAAGQTLLANAGWYDEDGDGAREAHNIPGIAEGTPFQVSYHTTDDPLRVQAAHLIRENLTECGIQASVESWPPETLFEPGPEGALFGRRFDLAQFSWRATPDPLCDLFLSSQIPDAGRWDRPNVVGFLDDEYDTACLAALAAFPGSAEYAAAHIEAQRIFSERLPVLPLFQRQKVTLARSLVIGLSPDPTQISELWNIEQLDLRP